MFAYGHIYMHNPVYTHKYKQTYSYMCINNVQVYLHRYLCVLTYMQINVCENVCTGTHTYIYTHI